MILKKFTSLCIACILTGITSIFAQSPFQLDTVYMNKSCKQVQMNIDTSNILNQEILNMLKELDDEMKKIEKSDAKKPD